MFKIILLVVTVFFSTMSLAASPAEMRTNFDLCTKYSPHWTERWGKYVVSFVRSDAERICHDPLVPYTVEIAGCSLNGQWKQAGYYCDEMLNP